MVGEANKQRVLDYFDALVRDDFGRIAELFADDVTWWMPRTAERFGMPVPSVGIETFLRLQRQGLDEIYHPQRWTTQKMVAEGDRVAVLTTLEAVTPAARRTGTTTCSCSSSSATGSRRSGSSSTPHTSTSSSRRPRTPTDVQSC